MSFGLFGAAAEVNSEPATVVAGAILLRCFARSDAPRLLAAITSVSERAPFRHMKTPGGYRMSIAMTNCERRAGGP
jgi:DNA oxidative demethylase